MAQLEEIATNHPEQLFVVFVDAVNQFHDEMQAWKMWWLPSAHAPNNLRFIISTLTKEHGTYDNARKQCPHAEIVDVEDMTIDEGEQMVSSYLARFNKKLTTNNDDTFLENQMSLLLSKNTSPLYLSAACETLRTQGVYEEMTPFIRKLPPTIPELFRFLLTKWSADYGEDFIKYLVCIITLSEDGLLENTISAILSYIEKKNY